MTERRIRCAVLTTHRYDYAAAITLVCPGLECVALPAAATGLAEAHNPYALPVDDRAEAILVDRSWYKWLGEQHRDRIPAVMAKLERKADVVIGMDGSDEFELGFPPEAIDRFATVIKFQGLYRDRDLHNYLVGLWDPGANWTRKERRRSPAYRSDQLEKLRLSVPCFMLDLPAVRRANRRRESGAAAGTIGRRMSAPERIGRNAVEGLIPPALTMAGAPPRSHDVHLMASLTHVQRLDALDLLAGFSGRRGIVQKPGTLGTTLELVAGTGRNYPLPDAVRQELRVRVEPYACDPLGRLRFLLDLCRHKVGVAPTGFGEITNRHREVLACGAALVCQDLSHVEIMFPFRDRENVVFCRPDLSDLRPKVEELLADDEQRKRIAREGKRTLTDWSSRWREHLDAGIEAHIREALAD